MTTLSLDDKRELLTRHFLLRHLHNRGDMAVMHQVFSLNMPSAFDCVSRGKAAFAFASAIDEGWCWSSRPSTVLGGNALYPIARFLVAARCGG